MKIRIVNKKRFYTVLILVLLLSTATVLGYNFYNEINNPEDLFEPKVEEPITYDVNDQFDKSKVNILVFGLDKNEYRDTVANYGVYRPDTIMLATLDFKENTIDLVSLPRDTYVPIYNRSGKDKINSTFMYASYDVQESEDTIDKGIEYLIGTVSNVLGDIPINYYVGITDMDVVTKIIDEIGGINIDVQHTLYAKNGKDRTKVRVEEGMQKLNGKDLQYYARYRMYPLGDIDRVASQQHIIKALLENLKSTNSLIKLPQIYNLVSENLTTNLSFQQISALSLFGTKVNKESLETYTLPGDFGELAGISYWIIQQNKRVEFLKEIYGIDAQLMTQDDTSDKLARLNASVGTRTLQVDERTKLTLTGRTSNGQQHTFDINDTRFSVSQSGIIQVNSDNTIVGRSPGNVTLSISAEGIQTSVSFTVQGQSAPIQQENEPEKPKDTTPPVIKGAKDFSIVQRTELTQKMKEQGVYIVEEESEYTWSVSGNVDVNKPGTYTLTYNASDSAGNKAVPVAITVTVTPAPETNKEPAQQ
ncbi:DUF5011 domain-containing protein [Alkalibaculum sp. M08DMB]|uniref:DUF5011 domain-containing protein n=1 Tax=Alkalibaculum sporogenes TaxID=2655001 RepID=A0A6A7KCX3_9FIRM|nr:LCP family protein [Alkalibaculum sporogenes]MPW27192.1 DUF5011 domain-containing protein [Alkalibaculum sporogenes]